METAGNQLFYILFPGSEVNRAAKCVYHTSDRFNIRPDGSMELRTLEITKDCCIVSSECNLYYYLSSDFRVIDLQAGDGYRKAREELAAKGVLIDTLSLAASLEQQLNSILYWTDSGWVSEGQLRAIENQ